MHATCFSLKINLSFTVFFLIVFCRNGVESDESPSSSIPSEKEHDHPVGPVGNGLVMGPNCAIDTSSSEDRHADSESCEELQEIISSDEEEAFERGKWSVPQDFDLGTDGDDVIKISEVPGMNGNHVQSTSSSVSASEDGSISSEESEDDERMWNSKKKASPSSTHKGYPDTSVDKKEPCGDLDSKDIALSPHPRKTLKKRKSTSADTVQQERRIRVRKEIVGEDSLVPGTTSDGPSPDTRPKVMKGILKVANARDSGGCKDKPKKNVRFKKGSNISEVVGVASGVGFDSVAMPNMQALCEIWRERGRGRGKGRGHGRGRGQGQRRVIMARGRGGQSSGPRREGFQKRGRGRNRGRKR